MKVILESDFPVLIDLSRSRKESRVDVLHSCSTYKSMLEILFSFQMCYVSFLANVVTRLTTKLLLPIFKLIEVLTLS